MISCRRCVVGDFTPDTRNTCCRFGSSLARRSPENSGQMASIELREGRHLEIKRHERVRPSPTFRLCLQLKGQVKAMEEQMREMRQAAREQAQRRKKKKAACTIM